MKLWMLAALRGCLDLRLGGIQVWHSQVGADGVVEEIGLLGDHADRGGERVERDIAQVVPVDADDSVGRVVEARDEIGQGGLARAGGTDQRDQLSGPGGEGDVLQGDLARLGGGIRFDRPLPRTWTLTSSFFVSLLLASDSTALTSSMLPVALDFA